ncbi:unnamed protein product [Psylliodes chrysocephalus]|uniref:Very long-chain fatty acid transport protein n=1 Tax=Psylliodes chrysocephalus TaxID=3402493 RepID=A0A9P0G527_9CUCU|nr:unnamed protein product [Psylliodes chrysocephala]
MVEAFKQCFCNQIWILPTIALITWFFWKDKRYRCFYIIYKTWRRDLMGIWMVARAMYKILKFERNKESVPKIFTKIAKSRPNKVSFYFEEEIWTFQRLEDFSNKVANYFIASGYQKGDTVALLLENRPEYVGIWMGLSKLGVITALINTNLISKPLNHCISVANVKALIFGSDFQNVINDIYPNLKNIQLIHYNTSKTGIQADKLTNPIDLKQCLTDQSVVSPEKYIANTEPKDILFYIYTSGTTGLPKAAKIRHSRFYFAVTGINSFLDLKDNDIFYNPLPLYHATGGMLTIGQCVNFGATIALRKKFSASGFWTDCNKYNCTIANYIGETCRYILTAHKDKSNIEHKIRKMIGNGLKKDIWKEFVDKFNIPMMEEFYGSTEGNSNLINLDNRIGSVGFIPFYLSSIVPMSLIKCNDETNEPLRDENGFCIKCKIDESGILIGKINKKISTQNFDGYVDTKETNKKILNDVFKTGDSYFNSGDLMVKDEFGYIYFKDRTGDTYRWKGENVATTEVEQVVSEIIGAKNMVVYGVEVPKSDGRAGMIAVEDLANAIDRKKLAESLKSHLPAYAIPLFLRIMDSLPMTGTFKVKKTELQNEGFDIGVIKDPIYVYDSKKIDYIPINDLYEGIIAGNVKI